MLKHLDYKNEETLSKVGGWCLSQERLFSSMYNTMTIWRRHYHKLIGGNLSQERRQRRWSMVTDITYLSMHFHFLEILEFWYYLSFHAFPKFQFPRNLGIWILLMFHAFPNFPFPWNSEEYYVPCIPEISIY